MYSRGVTPWRYKWKFGGATARIQYHPLRRVDPGPAPLGGETGGEVAVGVTTPALVGVVIVLEVVLEAGAGAAPGWHSEFHKSVWKVML